MSRQKTGKVRRIRVCIISFIFRRLANGGSLAMHAWHRMFDTCEVAELTNERDPAKRKNNHAARSTGAKRHPRRVARNDGRLQVFSWSRRSSKFS